MSKIEVDAIEPQSGTTLTLGASGDTITIPSGATLTNSGTATGFGKVLQVVSTTKTDTFTTASASYVDLTGGSVTITPSSASNKILVMAYVVLSNTTGTAASFFRVVRDSTAIGGGTAVSNRISAAGSFYPPQTYSTGVSGWHYLDSPSSTSSLTYKIQISVESGYTATVGRSGQDNDVAHTGRYPSIITVMEIAG